MYGYGYPYGYGYNIAGAGVALIIILLIAVGAVIALSIFCYVKFMGKSGDKNSKLGEFFDMKKLYLEQFIKILYMISAIACAVFSVATPFILWAATGSFLGFVIGLLAGAINLVIGEVVCRLAYEYTFMFVRMAGDTRAIRNRLNDGLEVTVKDKAE